MVVIIEKTLVEWMGIGHMERANLIIQLPAILTLPPKLISVCLWTTEVHFSPSLLEIVPVARWFSWFNVQTRSGLPLRLRRTMRLL